MTRTALGLGLIAVISFGAMAQQKEPENVCARGYDEARRSGPLSGSAMSEYGRSEVGEDKESMISKKKFDQVTPRTCSSVRKYPTILNTRHIR